MPFGLPFQSTLPREERRDSSLSQILSRRYFNPRSHERSDIDFPSRSSIFIFQSTLPREERRTGRHLLRPSEYFNPRSHERSDVKLDHLQMIVDISIHAPTRGATTREQQSSMYQRFQSTLPREERRLQVHLNHRRSYFNPRSHERSDCHRPALD